MITAKFFQEFTKQFSETLPPHFQNMKEEFQQQFYHGLQEVFSKLNLITREEFDIQVLLLEKTRDKVAQLEQRLLALQSEDP